MGSFKRFIVGLISMVAGAALTIYSFYIQAIPGITHSTPVIEIGWAFCTINCVLLTAGTFLLFTCINRPEAPRFVTDMSKLSYGMYLMHIFWLGVMGDGIQKIRWNCLLLPPSHVSQ